MAIPYQESHNNCCVVGCNSTYKGAHGTKFHGFPSKPCEAECRVRLVRRGRIWEDNLPALRSNTRNAAIYAAMAAQLSAGLRSGEEPYTGKQVRQKLENLNKQYRKLRHSSTTTGSKGVEWAFYWQLHNFLGCLPINNEFLAEENVEVYEVPLVDEAEDAAEVLASWDQGDDDTPYEDSATRGSEVVLPHSPGSQSRESLICEKDRANRDPLKGFGFRLKQIASQDARKPLAQVFSQVMSSRDLDKPWFKALHQNSTKLSENDVDWMTG
ncbi:hypothetical protein HPB47_012917 [Ixodes persulcatus]|uniref:Uncharacterized protein n=1 Tax=Ixodes persulcatus TaxID=34615 RepID=A0AC60NS65_IXOPE|nr:hypothetical protein HPB47_012917 [Ixodes persulcatus]